MVRSLSFLFAAAAVPLAASTACPGGVCSSGDSDADGALLQTKRAGTSAGVGHPEHTMSKLDQRTRFMMELDLQKIVQHRGKGRQSTGRRASAAPKDCNEQAAAFFDGTVRELGLAKELRGPELAAYKNRFVSAMAENCKHAADDSNWLNKAATQMEMQKPMMFEALSIALNKAGLGFQTRMKEWLLHETPATFEGRLGFLPVKDGQQSVYKRPQKRSTVQLPTTFRADERWPECADAVLRIHNQGHCGSCWAFGALASVDARMCIASNGAFNEPEDILSRLHVVSCAPERYNPGSEGCRGGWPHWAMEQVGSYGGVVSKSCVPYYIVGEGSEHFQQQDEAPPCVGHCQAGYSLGMQEDLFSVAGAENYDWLTAVHGDPAKIQRTKEAIYTEGPVSFAFKANHPFMGYSGGVFSACTGREHANHAVYTYGWGTENGEEFFESSNSWGANWGVNGHFKIHPLCITDVIIPGTMRGTIVSHDVGNVEDGVPPDPENENWPWKMKDECPFVDGCVTDMERDGDYADNEECVSTKLNGKRVRIEEFVTESNYDNVRVNGHSFSGTFGESQDLDALNGMVVNQEGIRFTSDFSVTAAGFKICDDTAECPFVDGCVTDMEGAGDYANDEACTSNKLNGKKIRVEEFNTEYGYDKLTVNGNTYTGSEGHGINFRDLDGIVVDGNGISFSSDFSVTAAGFKICEA